MSYAAEHLRELGDITAQLRRIETRRTELRQRAATLVIDLLRADVPPTEVQRTSPFSDAHVRTLARVNGIPPARRGRPKRA